MEERLSEILSNMAYRGFQPLGESRASWLFWAADQVQGLEKAIETQERRNTRLTQENNDLLDRAMNAEHALLQVYGIVEKEIS